MKLSKLNKLWCVHIFMMIAYVITKEYCNNSVSTVFRISADITSITLLIYSIIGLRRIIKDYWVKRKDKEKKAAWTSEHVSYTRPGEITITINSDLEKWEEDIISEIKEQASAIGIKVIEKNSLSEFISQYYS